MAKYWRCKNCGRPKDERDGTDCWACGPEAEMEPVEVWPIGAVARLREALRGVIEASPGRSGGRWDAARTALAASVEEER